MNILATKKERTEQLTCISLLHLYNNKRPKVVSVKIHSKS